MFFFNPGNISRQKFTGMPQFFNTKALLKECFYRVFVSRNTTLIFATLRRQSAIGYCYNTLLYSFTYYNLIKCTISAHNRTSGYSHISTCTHNVYIWANLKVMTSRQRRGWQKCYVEFVSKLRIILGHSVACAAGSITILGSFIFWKNKQKQK